jgi:hypothetical protein
MTIFNCSKSFPIAPKKWVTDNLTSTFQMWSLSYHNFFFAKVNQVIPQRKQIMRQENDCETSSIRSLFIHVHFTNEVSANYFQKSKKMKFKQIFLSLLLLTSFVFVECDDNVSENDENYFPRLPDLPVSEDPAEDQVKYLTLQVDHGSVCLVFEDALCSGNCA